MRIKEEKNRKKEEKNVLPLVSFSPLFSFSKTTEPTMSPNEKGLGRLISIYGVSPQYIQRAVFVAVLSFLFFIAMMVGFYIRQNIGYFLLATAFLIVYLVMMFSLFTMRRAAVKVFENGLGYKKHLIRWNDLQSVESNGIVVLVTNDERRIPLPSSLTDIAALARHIKFKVPSNG
jgi:hypothetical protein